MTSNDRGGVKALLKRGIRSRRSKLYDHMAEHHDEIARAMAGGRPDWAALASGFGEQGALDGADKMPTAECARQTWFRVRREVERTRAIGAAKSKPVPPPALPLSPGEIAPGVRPAIPVPVRASPPPASPEVEDDSPPNPSAEIERIRAIMKQRST